MAGGQVAALNCQGKGGHSYHNRQQNRKHNQNHLIPVDSWIWLMNHGIPRCKIDGRPINSYLICIIRKPSGQVNKSQA